jgi:hypothetical protein
MKALSIILWSAAIAVALSTSVHSQAPAAPKTTTEMLQKIKAENAKQLEKQAATLRKLDELAKEVQQLKIFGSRS